MEKAKSRITGVAKGVLLMGGPLALAVQVSPESATSNLSAWLRFLGLDRVPSFLLDQGADTVTTVIGVLLAAIGLGWLLWDRYRKPPVSATFSRIMDEATDANGDVDYERVRAEIDRLDGDQRERIWEELRREEEAKSNRLPDSR